MDEYLVCISMYQIGYDIIGMDKSTLCILVDILYLVEIIIILSLIFA